MVMRRRKRVFKAVLDWTASLAIIVISVWVVSGWRRPPVGAVAVAGGANTVPTERVSIADSARIGSPSAPVALILYSDFQCPFCQGFAEKTWPEIQRSYVQNGKVLFVFRHLPLPMHPDAMDAAVGAQCADQQRAFLPMHDRLFTKPQRLTPQVIRENAVQLRMDLPAFDECVKGSGAAAVRQQMEQANRWGVSGTPTFFLGRIGQDGKVGIDVRLDGLVPLERFTTVFKDRFGI